MVKQLDYLKLVNTARKSSYYAHPTRRDDALKNLVLVLAVGTILVTFAAAIVASYLGLEIVIDDVARPIGTSALVSLAYFILFIFLGGAQILCRYIALLISVAVGVGIAILAGPQRTSAWYLFVPTFLYVTIVGIICFRQVLTIAADRTVEDDA